jgi:hypothetical protein
MSSYSCISVRIFYNGMRCYNLYYIPGEKVVCIRNEIVRRHLLTAFKMRSNKVEELDGEHRLGYDSNYEIICEYGKDIRIFVAKSFLRILFSSFVDMSKVLCWEAPSPEPPLRWDWWGGRKKEALIVLSDDDDPEDSSKEVRCPQVAR